MQFNPTRLDLARRRRGMTKVALADTAGISTRILSAYSRGDKTPAATTVERLASALSFPEDFFFGDDLHEPPLDGSSFRALTSLTARQRDQALGSGAVAMAFMAWLDSRFELPEPSVPEYRGIDAEGAAEALRREWGLGERPIKNMVHLLEYHGVRVFSLNEECREVDAYSFWRSETPFVFLNTQKSAERSRMDAAHELGHLVLHSNGGPRGREAEREADAFGSALLMPRSSVLALAPRGGGLAQLVKAKKHWTVSVAALAYRMHVVGLLTDWQYRSLFIELGAQGYRSDEPESAPRESSQVLGKVFKALRDEGVSMRGIASDLAVPVEEINTVIFGLALTPVPERVA